MPLCYLHALPNLRRSAKHRCAVSASYNSVDDIKLFTKGQKYWYAIKWQALSQITLNTGEKTVEQEIPAPPLIIEAFERSEQRLRQAAAGRPLLADRPRCKLCTVYDGVAERNTAYHSLDSARKIGVAGAACVAHFGLY